MSYTVREGTYEDEVGRVLPCQEIVPAEDGPYTMPEAMERAMEAAGWFQPKSWESSGRRSESEPS